MKTYRTVGTLQIIIVCKQWYNSVLSLREHSSITLTDLGGGFQKSDSTLHDGRGLNIKSDVNIMSFKIGINAQIKYKSMNYQEHRTRAILLLFSLLSLF